MPQKENPDWQEKLSRRNILKTTAASAAVPGFAAVQGAADDMSGGPRRTNGRADVPATTLTGERGAPVTADEIEKARKALLRANDTLDRVVLENNIARDGEDILAYGLRIENGAPVEYVDTIPTMANRQTYKTVTAEAHQRVAKFKRGEL